MTWQPPPDPLRGFRLERELPGGICTHDICALWQAHNGTKSSTVCSHFYHYQLPWQAATQLSDDGPTYWAATGHKLPRCHNT
jgi:hypothetical protein